MLPLLQPLASWLHSFPLAGTVESPPNEGVQSVLLHRLQHHLNSLHIMALAGRLGVPSATALTLARWWERRVHPALYLAFPRPGITRVRSFARVKPRSPLFR